MKDLLFPPERPVGAIYEERSGGRPDGRPPNDSGSQDGVDGAGIGTGTAIGAGIRINDADVSLLTDSLYRTGGLTGPAINTFFGNGISHWNHLLFSKLSSEFNYATTSSDPLSTPKNSSRYTKILAFFHHFL